MKRTILLAAGWMCWLMGSHQSVLGQQPELVLQAGHAEMIYAVAFSPDGETLASVGADGTTRLWNVGSGVEMRSLAGHNAQSVVFSPDGKRLATGGGGKIVLWDIYSGASLKQMKVNASVLRSIAFSPDGGLLASGGEDNLVHLWNVASGAELKALSGHTASPKTGSRGAYEIDDVHAVAFSPDGKWLASGGDDYTVRLWEISSGKELKVFRGHEDEVDSVAFSPDGKWLASGSADRTARVWDVASGGELKTLSKDSESVRSVIFSPDGKTIAHGNVDGVVSLWNVASGSNYRSFRHNASASAVAFSPDGETLAVGKGFGGKDIVIWDLASGAKLQTFQGSANSIYSVALSPDHKFLATGAWRDDNGVQLWDLANGVKLRSLELRGIVFVDFSPDGTTLAGSSRNGETKLWDVASGNEIKYDKLPAWVKGEEESSTVTEINGRKVGFSVRDGQIDIGNPDTQEVLASLVSFGKDDWLVTTPAGLFDGSPEGWKKMHWRFNNNTFDYGAVEFYFNVFYHPNLLQDVLAGRAPRPPRGSELGSIDRRQPSVLIYPDEQIEAQMKAQPNGAAQTKNRKVMLTIVVVDNTEQKRAASHSATSGAQDLRLFRNGSLVKIFRGDIFKSGAKEGCEQIAPPKPGEPRRASCRAEVSIVAGNNTFTAYAFNDSDLKSEDATLKIVGAQSLKRKGTAYIVAVGVNAYANAQYNLKYAVDDAREFGAEIKRQQERLGTFERVELVSLFDHEATKEKITQALRALQGRTAPEDAVIVYFAGHGTAEQQKFYLIPHDLGYTGERKQLTPDGLQTILARSISDRELEAIFEKIDAGQFLLVIDACNSGQALEAEEKRRGPMNSKGLAQLAYEKGMYILTAAQSYQAALEAAQFGHGLLTYALVEEGLKKEAADQEPRDGQVMAREWFNYATSRVPKMQEEKMRAARDVGVDLVFLEGEARTTEGGGRSLQQPRLFYRRELEAQPLIIAKAETSARPMRQ
ncbi:MAG: caspase family protein [Pyrinomonadaceae bacterium]